MSTAAPAIELFPDDSYLSWYHEERPETVVRAGSGHTLLLDHSGLGGSDFPQTARYLATG